MINELENINVNLPTAFHQVIDSEGKGKLTKISGIELPLTALIQPGFFQISQVEVGMPEKIESSSHIALKITYQYHILSKTLPAIVQINPFLDLKIENYVVDLKIRNRCFADGYIEVRDGETNEPLSNTKIYLNIKSGNIIPNVGYLNKRGKLKFEIIGHCDDDGKLTTSICSIYKRLYTFIRSFFKAAKKTLIYSKMRRQIWQIFPRKFQMM